MLAMSSVSRISRREFVQAASLVTAAAAFPAFYIPGAFAEELGAEPLTEFGYGDVTITSELHERQLHETQATLMELSEDGLLKPFRQMIGKPAPGPDLGGWYHYDPDYDWHTFEAGFAPACTFGQWVSALARVYAVTGDPKVREK